jgi:hypothetical protein
MPNETKIESRISENKHFAQHLRSRLLKRACPAVREALSHLNDADLVAAYFANEARGREHAAKQRIEKQAVGE